MRINKFIAECGLASRRKAELLIKNGDITINGKVMTDLSYDVKDSDKVFNKDIQLSLKDKTYVYYKLNKPKGYICSASDEKGRKTVFDLVKTGERLFTIGRLDYNTEGLIILTNDGEFANKISHPSHEIEKEYSVKIEGKIKESEMAVLRAGVVVDEIRMPKSKVKFVSVDAKTTKLSVVIHEGQNHQVRKMFEAIGKTIVLLQRVRIGDVRLGGLSRGEYKPLTESELFSLENC